MPKFIHRFFDAHAFLSHGHCYMWNPALVGIHVTSDLLIGLSYIAISVTLWMLVRRAQRDIPFHWLFLAFGTFIIACGGTHLMEVWTVWTPLYWLSGAVKMVTAAASVTTAFMLPRAIPKVMQMIVEAQVSTDRQTRLEAANVSLLRQAAERSLSEQEIRRLNEELQGLLHTQTGELARVDSQLASTIEQLERTNARYNHLGESDFQLIANSIQQLAWVGDADGWIYWYNQRWYEYTGTTPEQMQGWGWKAVHDPKYLDIVLDQWKRALESDAQWVMEFPLRGADGNFRMFTTRAAPVKNREGRVVRWVGTNTDVEDQRRSQERQRALYESDLMGVFHWKPDGAIFDCNGKFLEIIGYDKQDLQAGTLDWVALTPAEYLAQDQDVLEQLQRVGAAKPVEKEFFRKDGSRVSVELGAAVTNVDSSGGIAFVLDITNRKEAEASLVLLNHSLAESQTYLSAIVRSATEVAIIVTDPKGIISIFNPGAERMLQYRADEVIGIYTPVQFHTVEERREQAIIVGKQLGRNIEGFEVFSAPVIAGRTGEREWTYVRKDGSTLFVSLSTSAIRDGSGNVVGFLKVATDITARKRLEIGLAERSERLESALAEKTVLLKEVHHRVKNNLTVVASLLEMQADVVQNEDALKPLLESQRRVYSMALIHEHLYGTKNLSRVCFDEYAETLANELYTAFASPERIAVKIEADPIELPIDTAIPCGLILNELLSNAFKYAFPQGRPGTIRVGFARDDVGNFHLTVKDDGVGIPAALDWTKSDTLGLKIVQILSHQLAGTFQFCNHSGTDFEMIFPAQEFVAAG